MKNNYVAINIVDISTGKLLNKKNVPIVFYWDSYSNILDYLRTDDTFKNYVVELCCNKELYTSSFISYILVQEDDNYIQNGIDVQDLYVLDNLPDNYKNFYFDYIKYHFNYLYKCSYKEDYQFTFDMNADILSIYDKIQEKHPNKVIKETVINYIQSVLIKEDKLSKKNCDILIDVLQKILVNKE